MRLIRNAGDSIDIFSAPISYRSERGWLGSTIQMPAIETLTRNGILWVAEDDTVTHHDCGNWYEGRKHRATSACTPGQAHDILRRNLAVQTVRGTGSWWMDLNGWNWYYDPALWRQIGEFAAFDREMLQRTEPHIPDVAAFVDEET